MSTRKSNKNKPADFPVFPPAVSKMKVDFLFNEAGGVWLLHDQPLPAVLTWAEYDADFGTVSFLTETGKIMELGIEVPAKVGLQMECAKEITTLLMHNSEIRDFSVVPMITRNTSN